MITQGNNAMASAAESLYLANADYNIIKVARERDDFLREQTIKNQRLEEQAKVIAEKDAKLADKETEIASMKIDLADKDAEIQRLQAMLANKGIVDNNDNATE